MQEKFKQYLEGEFRKVPPTRQNRDYRIELFHQLTDYAQELRLKGIDNDDVIFDLAIKSLGNLDEKLQDFQKQKQVKKQAKTKKTATLISVLVGIGLGLLLMIIVGLAVPSGFKFSWIFMLFGVFAMVTAVLLINVIQNPSEKKQVILRLSIFAIVTLWLIFITLALLVIQIGTNNEIKVKGWWIGFIVIPFAIALSDAITAFTTNQQGKWINFSVDLIVVSVMLYVIIGLILGSVLNVASMFWAYGWLIIIAGVIGAVLTLVLVKKAKEKRERAELGISGNEDEIDEKYYTEW